jgi:hypothetical protein
MDDGVLLLLNWIVVRFMGVELNRNQLNNRVALIFPAYYSTG